MHPYRDSQEQARQAQFLVVVALRREQSAPAGAGAVPAVSITPAASAG